MLLVRPASLIENFAYITYVTGLRIPDMMRRASTALGHPGSVVMPGVVVMPLTAPDRLRMYRRCFHELEEQMMMLQVEGREAEVLSLQAELRFLEELIMVFTELNPVPPNKQSVIMLFTKIHSYHRFKGIGFVSKQFSCKLIGLSSAAIRGMRSWQGKENSTSKNPLRICIQILALAEVMH